MYFDQQARLRCIVPEAAAASIDAAVRIARGSLGLAAPLRVASDTTRPFFIVGSGRSGNTLLRRILTAHPGLHVPPETHVLPSLVKQFRRSARADWRVLVENALQVFVDHPEFPTFGNMDIDRLREHLVALPMAERSLAAIISHFYAEHARIHGKRYARWGDKTPAYALSLDRLHAVFPRAQYIHMIRDGYDSVSSYLEAGFYTDVEHAAVRWLVSNERVDRFLARHDHGMTVRYEDLVSRTEQVVSEVCTFLGVQFMPSQLQPPGRLGDVESHAHHAPVRQAISAQSIGKGRSRLSPRDLERVKRIIGDKMEAYGYDGGGFSVEDER